MMSESISLLNKKALGVRLRQAREARGWTQQKSAEIVGLARTTMVAIEKGERRLKPAELVQLARLYDRKVSEILQDAAPGDGSLEDGFSVQLRGELRPSAPVDANLLPHIDAFEHLCRDYVHLEKLCQAPLRRHHFILYEIGAADPETVAEDAATAERRRLGLGDGPLLNLRDMLESDIGLRIFQPELPSAVAGMFAFTEGFGGCIAVNRKHPLERRRQSMAHELGHFLTNRSRSEILYVDRYERRPAQERFAETFARAFLLPADGLRRRYLALLRERDGAPTHGDLCRLAHFFAVSVEAMTRRLEELRLIPSGVWDRLLLEGFKVQEAREILGLEPTMTEDGLLPRRFVALAVEAWQRGELSEGQLARFLRVDRLAARATIELLQQSRGEGGEVSPAIDLSAQFLEVG